MIEWTTWLWFAAGGVAGCLHATLLWRSTHRLTAWTPLLGMLRLGLVATLLVSAALGGQILTAAAGWAVAFAALVVLFFAWPTSRKTRSPNSGSIE